jgi:hypothetical protein
MSFAPRTHRQTLARVPFKDTKAPYAPHLIYRVDMYKGEITFDGHPVRVTQQKKIGSGAYGDIMAVVFEDPFDPSVLHKFAMKVPKRKRGVFSTVLDEIEVAGAYARIYECAHLIPIVVTREKTIVMPLTTGDLTNMRGCLVAQAHHICGVLLEALYCLARRDSPVFYLDLKPQNVLYVDNGKGVPDVMLGDLGSIIPLRGRYAATHPYPLSHSSGWVDVASQPNHIVETVYPYQIALLYAFLVTTEDQLRSLPGYNLSDQEHAAALGLICTTMGGISRSLSSPERRVHRQYLALLREARRVLLTN